VLLFLGLSYFSYNTVYPGLYDTEEKKNDTIILAEKIQEIQKKGLSYTNFSVLGKKITTGT